VSRQRFVPGDRSPRVPYDGRPYFFYTEANKAAFEADPATYAKVNADNIKMM